ncbi:iron hydrogenase, partial [Dehalococcoides mccartyi]
MESIWKEKVDGVITQSGSSRLSLLPCLEAVQEECGYIPHEAVNYLRECLSIPSIDIYGMITFYSLLSTNQKGKYVIRLCNSLPCYLNGTENILDTLVDNLGIEPGQTTLDHAGGAHPAGALGHLLLPVDRPRARGELPEPQGLAAR